jgi:adenosylcobinamide-GDP ribazoletransferase
MGGTYLLADLALPAGPVGRPRAPRRVLLTGGFHEDGLADSADAFGAHVSRERKLEILRDSRIGTFGGLALVFALLFAYASLIELDGTEVLVAGIAGHALGRWSGLPQSLWLPQARPEGSGTLVKAAPGVTRWPPPTRPRSVRRGRARPGAIALGVAVIVTAIAGVAAVRVFGGISGDTFGATNKLVELAVYAALAGAL